MKLIFADLDEMISELREKGIKEVRIEPLYDKRLPNGMPIIRLYVNVHALLHGLCCEHQEVIFKGVELLVKEEMKEKFDRNLERCDEIKAELTESGFIVRAGHFED